MNPEIKQKWCTALRSGEYRQGRHTLFNGGQYCCLGVLCDIYLKENNITEGEQYWKFDTISKEARYNNVYNIPLSAGILPPYVALWSSTNQDSLMGIDGRNPIIEGKTLSLHNDDGKSFHEIADLIEKHL